MVGYAVSSSLGSWIAVWLFDASPLLATGWMLGAFWIVFMWLWDCNRGRV